VIAVAALVGLIVWLVVESGSNSSPKSTAETKAVALSASGLTTLAGALRQPVYWVGAKPGGMYEVTQKPGGIYVRYLPGGAKAGDKRSLLTIGSYPMRDAFKATTAAFRRSGATELEAPGGGVAFFNKQHPRSVYVVYPAWTTQVEVYDSSPAAARRVATSGLVRPVLALAPSRGKGPTAVSPEQLKVLAASVGHPIYWVGARPSFTYELTQTPEGQTYIRYLPKGVAVGAKEQAYLTVATYPMANAFAVTQGTGKGPGVVTLTIPGDGVAIYNKTTPTNVHLAYPGVDAQVEIYDISPKVPPKLAESGQVVPVG
jgi:hypothetical protein